MSFKNKIKEELSLKGYTRISVYPNLFSTKADVFAKTSKGKHVTFRVKYSNGRLLYETNDYGWIEELEILDALIAD